MPSTYEPIATATASGSSNSVAFSSITSTYTDLVLVMSVRSTVSASTTQAILILNGDAGSSSYSRTVLKGDGSSASSFRDVNFSQLYFVDDIPGATNTTNYFSQSNIQIMNYSNTTTFKTLLGRNTAPSNNTEGMVGLWRNTAAISSVSISAVSGNWASGSTFTLYGIKAA
jgi:hypothetical protein